MIETTTAVAMWNARLENDGLNTERLLKRQDRRENRRAATVAVPVVLCSLLFVPNQSCIFNRPHSLWLGGRVVRTLDLRSIGREFESWPLRYRVQLWAS